MYYFIDKVFEKLNFIRQKAKAKVIRKRYNLSETIEIKYGLLKVYGNFFCGDHCKFLNDITIHANSKVEIGRYTVINGPNTDIYASINEVKIGSFCSIARNVSIQEFNHNVGNFTTSLFERQFSKAKKDFVISKGNIEIGNDVWIGSHCVVLSGSKIGDGCVITANSVVVGEIPPYAIAGGTPAKVIKYRFDEDKIAKLIQSNWWDNINEVNYEEYAVNFNNNSNL